MLLTKELFYGLDYYKRNVFMGSSDKLYFRIYKIEVAEAKNESHFIIWFSGALIHIAKSVTFFLLLSNSTLAPAFCSSIFIFDKTPEEKKTYKRFPYEEESLEEIATWLNEEHDKIGKE